MACMKIGSKSDVFQRKGQAWFCTTGLPSDVVIDVGEMSFHLHKFPLMSRSGMLTRLVTEAPDDDDEGGCVIRLDSVPGGPDTFELTAKFCYGVKVELTASNAAALRCAAEYLEMTEEFGEGNLIVKTESFFNQVILKSWNDSVTALQSCEALLPQAEELHIVKKCVDSIATKACTDPALFGWPLPEHTSSLQSPGGSVLWNGISTGARPRFSRSDWWYDDISVLTLPLFQRIVSAMERKGLRSESIAGAIMHYAKNSFPLLTRREKETSSNTHHHHRVSTPILALSEIEQRTLLESLESLLPPQKGIASARFLFGLLRTAMILNVNPSCKQSLEERIGEQLEQASLEDLLIPNYSYTSETLYDVDCVERILDHFLIYNQTHQNDSPESYNGENLNESTPMMAVAKLIDGYLAEIAPDVNLKPAKFQALAEALPDYARVMDDGLYRAVDTYLKAHPWLTEQERGRLSSTMDCQKLSLEACTHAAQNERLPLRVVVQVLFFEQLQLRAAISGSFMGADFSDPSLLFSRPMLSEGAPTGPLLGSALRENQVLKVDMETIRTRMTELENECSTMRNAIQKIQKPSSSELPTSCWNRMAKKLGWKFKFDLCDCPEKATSGRFQLKWYIC